MAPDSVRTLNILDNNIITSKIGDSQVTKLKIADNSVDVAKLDVTDGNSGDILSTNGAGVLSFIPQLTSLSVGGVLTGTTDNASIANNAVVNAMLATGIDAGKLIGELSSNVTGVGGETFRGYPAQTGQALSRTQHQTDWLRHLRVSPRVTAYGAGSPALV